MEPYNEWQDENEIMSPKYPINDYYISPNQNQDIYMQARIISPNYDNMHTPPRQNIQMREEKIKNEYNNNYIINNQRIVNDNYEYPQYKNIRITKQYYDQRKNEDNYNINNTNSNNNINSTLKKYESSDGVLRGYTNNYSFYVSGSTQIKPKITINNQYSNKNYNNISNQNKNINNPNKRQFIYKNSPSPQSGPRQYQKIIYSNNNNTNNINSNYGNRQTNQNENSSYIIRMVEDDPVIYNQPNQDQNTNNNYEDDDIYYYEENENRNISQRNYQGPIVQRRMVKRVIEKEPFNSKRDYYVFGPNDNMRNMNKKYSNQKIQQKPIYKKINNYNNTTTNNNNNFKRFYSNNLNENINNINQRNDYFESYPLKRTNTPNVPRPINRQYSNYSRPVISRQQKLLNRSPNIYGTKNSNNSISYPTRNNQYNAYEEQSDYFITQTESNSSKYKTPFMYNSPNIDNDNYNNVYVIPMRREREYTSRTELQNQGGYELEYENDDINDDDVYEVPEQYNNNVKGFYIEKRQNMSNRPFTRINNYSQNQRDGRKYGVYTQTMAINKNYNRNYDEEYEVDRRNIRYIRNDNNRNNYSVPKIMKPINDVQRLVRQKREYSAFERSLRNIRDNEEEIELENEERNNKVRIKTSGSNNHKLYISNNSRDNPSKQYKTYTELQTDRPQGYFLQDIDDDNPEEYRIGQNSRNINKNNNIRVVQRNNENEFQPIPPPRVYRPEEKNYYEDENTENFQKINTQNNEEIEDEEEDQMYDTNQLMAAKEGNLKIIHKRSEEGFKQNPDIQNSEENYNDIEGEENEEELIQKVNTNINTNTEEDLYQNEDIPQDRDEPMSIGNKNVKNIQTEINEKYYDNQGNYLGEKKIITTKQVPINNENQINKMNQINNYNNNNQQEEGEYQEEEEQEENENEDDEYIPYQSNNKKFKKRGDINNKNIIESKYHSYFGDSNNNVYYEIKGVSGEINKEEESKKEEEIEKRNYKEPMVQVKNITFGIQSENLCVPGQDKENEEKDNIEEKGNNDEKEADEQGIDENVIIDEEEDEEQNNMNDNKVKIENLKINLDINENNMQEQHINDNDNNNIKDDNYIDKNNILNKEENDNDINKINEINNNEDYENKNSNENFENIEYNNNYEEHIEENINNNYEEHEEENNNNNIIEENIDNNNNNNEIDIKNSNDYEEQNIKINNDENNINIINNNNYENSNKIKNGNHFEYEEEQIVEENEEEIENENIQKDEVEEAKKEGLVDIEENDTYNYEEIEGEEAEEEEKKEEYIEENNINKEEDENAKEN